MARKSRVFSGRKIGFGKRLSNTVGRLFCKRSIIIISERKTQHVPFSGGVQVAGLLATTAFIVWASYSSGSYMAAQSVLEEKDRKLANSARENMRVSAEFALLKSDLMRLATVKGKADKTADAAKQLAERYSQPTVAGEAAQNVSIDDEELRGQYEAVFQRIEYLDNKVKELQSNHDEMMADIRATTGGKIRELEKVIARTGMEAKPLEKAADAARAREEQRREKYGRIEDSAKGNKADGGQGGPFIPARSVLKERETELYFNLRRLMALNDIVGAMPLAAPLQGRNYRQTSGFGVRSDPFRGESAYHSGVDLAGPDRSKVLATSDGKVEFAGWKSAYGNVVDIKHAYGLTTRYAHLARVTVQPEQTVKKGQIIGIQGSTGRSTGHHLHYEVRYQGRAINPSNFLKAGEDVRATD